MLIPDERLLNIQCNSIHTETLYMNIHTIYGLFLQINKMKKKTEYLHIKREDIIITYNLMCFVGSYCLQKCLKYFFS